MANKVKKELILLYLKNHKISKSKFCKENKISIKSFNKVINEDSLEIITLLKIARTMDIEVKQLINK